jgi:tetratricopeptide (TPR) repeat protein
VQSLASKIADGKMEFSEARILLEFIASRYPEAWLLLADLAGEVSPVDAKELEPEYLRRYIESNPTGSDVQNVWDRLAHLYRSSGDVLAACAAYTRAFELGRPPYYALSNAANWLNNQRDAFASFEMTDKRAVFMPFATLMEARLEEASATDLSRLAWLYLHAGNPERSEEVARRGLSIEPDNVHCQRLIDRLTKDQH